MAQPGTDGIDIHPCTQQMCGGRVSQSVRTHSFCQQGRHIFPSLGHADPHQSIDTEPRERFSMAIQEHSVVLRTTFDQPAELFGCVLPERTAPYLSTFSVDADTRCSMWSRAKVEISNLKSCRFTGTNSRVVEKQQQRMVPVARGRGAIGHS